MFLSRRKDNIFETNDLLIVFDDEKKTSDIERVTHITDEAIMTAGKYNVPLNDCEVTNSIEGRNFFYRAPSQSVKETRRLAQLERSIVLQQITNYKKPEEKADLSKLLLVVAVIIGFIMFGVSSCAGGGG